MNRTDLLRQLRAHKPFDEREGEMLERITDFVRDLVATAESKALQWVALDEFAKKKVTISGRAGGATIMPDRLRLIMDLM